LLDRLVARWVKCTEGVELASLQDEIRLMLNNGFRELMQGLLAASVVPFDKVVEVQANELVHLVKATRLEGSEVRLPSDNRYRSTTLRDTSLCFFMAPPRQSYAGSADRAQGELPEIF
jgi:hypothetical protein